MADPAITLLVGLSVLAVAGLLLWPDRGLIARWTRARRANKRVQVEDALKHLYDCEARGLPCTLLSLAGALGIGDNETAGLLSGLLDLGLVVAPAEGYVLTPAGRSEALRVVRVHRLWERYLAERTGVGAAEWHRIADEREHTTTPEEAAALAAATGHPRFDPHGDPIPTEDGQVVPPPGVSLAALEVGEVGEVVHLEDEPDVVYAQLLAQGLHLGMQVRVLEVSPARIRFEADGEEHVVAPLVAANLSVARLDEGAEQGGPFELLSELDVGESATVVGISPACRGVERRRMLDLGLLPGTRVTSELRARGGDPTGYRIRGAVIALRREQARHIRIERQAGREVA